MMPRAPSSILKSTVENYFIYYFSGALFFSLVSSVLTRAPGLFLVNEHFIKKVAVPKLTFVLNGVAYELVTFLLSGAALVFLGLISGKMILSLSIFSSFTTLVMVFFFLMGLSCGVSIATVYFRDLSHIIPVILQALFFITPIIYTIDMANCST